MPVIFGDHMVLQQDRRIPVWGTAAPGEKVTVTLGHESGSAQADASGDWRVDLPPIGANAAPQTLTVAGTNTLTFHDVLIGDVWVESGQSNMEFGIGGVPQAADIMAKADEPMIRLFCVPKATSLEPRQEIGPPQPDVRQGQWQVCTPDSLAHMGGPKGFSAVGYFFGHELQQATGHPIGLLGTWWGGTPGQAWTSLDGLKKDKELAYYVGVYQKTADNYAKAQAELPQLQADFAAAKKQWDAEVGAPMKPLLDAWYKDSAAAIARGQAPPARPVPSRPEPKPPVPPDGGYQGPANLYNAMIVPLMPFAIKGVAWYQGESNGNTIPNARLYAVLFPRLITDWREKWGEGNFPFLFVQIADFGAPAKLPSEGSLARLRESQTKALSLPNTGMAVAIDVGNPYDIHPKDKLDVGHRLALAARHVAYGEDIVYSGPIYDSMEVSGGKIVLHFKNIGSGLKIGAPPWSWSNAPLVVPTELTGFGIAGEDRKWVWAQAVISGDTVIVSSDEVPAPVAVRYGWANTPACDLYNREGLPASPFRTDDWEDPAPVATPGTTPGSK